jgi:MFS transporter, FHS family, L-fucose permease
MTVHLGEGERLSRSIYMNTPPAPTKYTMALVLTVLLYALWGMAHNLNDVLIPKFKDVFTLTDFQSALVQTAFYVSYLAMPIPVALYLQRFGYKIGVITGLCFFAIGALIFWPAASMLTYEAFLFALLVIGFGMVFIETSGTGIIVSFGGEEDAEWRINLAQAFNPMGSIVGLVVGAQFILSKVTESEKAAMTVEQLKQLKIDEAHAVQIPYLIIALVVFGVAALVAMTKFPPAATETSKENPLGGLKHLLKSPIFVWGVVAQFFYVGTQVGVWSFIVKYAKQYGVVTNDSEGGFFLTAALVTFLIGRFCTLPLLRRYSSAQIAVTFAVIAGILTVIGITMPGTIGMYAIIAISFFMSIMFPGIYAIGLYGNIQYSKPASALMVMSIVGAGILPAIMGQISDMTGSIAIAYSVPLVGFFVVLGYCWSAVKSGRVGGTPAAGH